MKKLLLSLLIAFTLNCSMQVYAQTAAKALYAELGGPGLASINYDMRFKKEEAGLGFRVGVGGYSLQGTSLFTLPVGINYLIGKDQKNYFEIGAGFTYVNYKDNYFTSGDNFSSSFGNLTLGYRIQPAKGGFFFKAEITPVFGSGFFTPLYGGVAFGYKF
jgi:hypothetical protein